MNSESDKVNSKMEDEEFNFYKLGKCEKNVAKRALEETFITVWKRKFKKPWKNDAESVQLFEKKEKELFETRIQNLSNPEKKRKTHKRKKLLAAFTNDDSWKNCKWDINRIVYALISSKVFDSGDLAGDTCDHIDAIKQIRNDTAHSTTYTCTENELRETVESLTEHIKGLETVLDENSLEKYLSDLENIQKERKPGEGLEKIKHEFKILKLTLQFQQEKEKYYTETDELKEKLYHVKQENQKYKVEQQINKEKIQDILKQNKDLESEFTKLEHCKSDAKRYKSQRNILFFVTVVFTVFIVLFFFNREQFHSTNKEQQAIIYENAFRRFQNVSQSYKLLETQFTHLQTDYQSLKLELSTTNEAVALLHQEKEVKKETFMEFPPLNCIDSHCYIIKE